MKRQSYDEVDFDTGGPLTDKWVVKNVSKPSTCSQRLSVTGSYVEFEELNEFGRFSYNSFNKDVEVIITTQWFLVIIILYETHNVIKQTTNHTGILT